jgi:hypothetical protein
MITVERQAFVNNASIFIIDAKTIIEVKDENKQNKLKFWYHNASNILMIFGDHTKVNVLEYKEKEMIEIRYKDIDPDSGNITTDNLICYCESPLIAEWVYSAIIRDMSLDYDEPNREIYIKNEIQRK